MEKWRAKLALGDTAGAWDEFISRYQGLIYSVIRRTLNDPDDIAEIFAELCGDLSRDDLELAASHVDVIKARYSTWLVTVVHNRTIDWVRKREGRRRFSAPEGLSPVQGQIFQCVVCERRPHAEAYEMIAQRSPTAITYRDFLRELSATYRILQKSGRMIGRFFPGQPPDLAAEAPDTDASLLLEESSSRVGAAMSALEPDERLAVQLFVIDEVPAAQVAKIVGWPNAKTVYNRVSRALARMRKELAQHSGPGE